MVSSLGVNSSSAAAAAACTLFLAPSTIPDAGLGVYTAQPLQRGERIVSADPVIPILDLEWHNGWFDFASPNPFRNYVWSGRAVGMSFEVESFELVTAFWPGLDAAVNSHAAINNLRRSIPTIDADMNGRLHRSRDSSVGSFSPYVGGHTYVQEDVPAGGELFKNYGDEWFFGRNYTFPVASDYPIAANLLERFYRTIPQEMQKSVYDHILAIRDIWDQPRVLQALPDPWENIQQMFATGNKIRPDDILQFFRKLQQPNTIRTLDWLQEHGTCFDAMEMKNSRIPGAGRGAFARRSFRTDQIITTSPLLHFLDKEVFVMKNVQPDPNNPGQYLYLEQIGKQLALNYCFSHKDTTLLLCPYGAGVNAINHGSLEEANVRVEWPEKDGFLCHNASFLEMPLQDWDPTDQSPKLAISYVAIKPIAEGEELLLHYGKAWETAFQNHAAQWKVSNMGKYISAATWNKHYQHKELLHTKSELVSLWMAKHFPRPPSNLQLRCHSEIVHIKHSAYSKLVWDVDAKEDTGAPEYGFPCRVMNRTEAKVTQGNATSSPRITYTYDVAIRVVEDLETGETTEHYRHNVPRHCLRWFDKPHTSDMHLPKAFRKELGLPDSLVPREWRNLKSS